MKIIEDFIEWKEPDEAYPDVDHEQNLIDNIHDFLVGYTRYELYSLLEYAASKKQDS